LESGRKELEQAQLELKEVKEKWDKRVPHPELDKLSEQIDQMKSAVELLGMEKASKGLTG
jgi:uncharacterized protein YjgD (DUF1641 family)